MPFSPDTPANRALLRAVRAGDPRATVAALEKGASPHASYGKWGSITCSALMRAVDFKERRTGNPEVVRILLEAGAHPWSSPFAQGRAPLEFVMRNGHENVLRVFVEHFGGAEQMIAWALREKQGYRVLDALLASSMTNDYCRELFFKALERIPAPLWPASRVKGISWPWDHVASHYRVNLGVVARLEKRIKRPRLEELGLAKWLEWMKAVVNSRTRSVLADKLLQATPLHGWLEPLPGISVASGGLLHTSACLLELLVDTHANSTLRKVLKALLADLTLHLRVVAMGPSLLRRAAQAGAPPAFRMLQKALGNPSLSREEATEMALLLTESSYDCHHRLNLLSSLAPAGLDLEARQGNGPTLLEKLLSWPTVQRAALVDAWMAEGLDWSVQDDRGVSRLTKLAAIDPERAAAWRQARLESTLPEEGLRLRGPRL